MAIRVDLQEHLSNFNLQNDALHIAKSMFSSFPDNLHIMGPWANLPPTYLNAARPRGGPFVLHRCCKARNATLRDAELKFERYLMERAAEKEYITVDGIHKEK
jgi:hypothetical protein